MFNKKLIDLNLNRSKLINLKNSLSYLIENPILVIECRKELGETQGEVDTDVGTNLLQVLYEAFPSHVVSGEVVRT